MNNFLISGNNKISEYLHNTLLDKDYLSQDISNVTSFKFDPHKSYGAVIDTNSALGVTVRNSQEADLLEIRNLIDLAAKLNVPFIFLYKESSESESSTALYLDYINTYTSQVKVKASQILIDEIYGKNLNTCDKLVEFLESIVSGDPLNVTNDNREYYLIHENDFLDGLIKSIEYIANSSQTARVRNLTLLPEESITEIELAHFINDLNELPSKIDFSNREDVYERTMVADVDTNYPENWYPIVDLEKGLKELLDIYGIPALGTSDEEYDMDSSSVNNPQDIYDEPDNTPVYVLNNHTFDKYTSPGSSNFPDLQKEDVFETAIAENKPQRRKRKTANMKIAGLVLILIAVLAAPSVLYTFKLSRGLAHLDQSIKYLSNYEVLKSEKESSTALKFIPEGNPPFLIKTLSRLFHTKNDDLALFVSTSRKSARAIKSLSTGLLSYASGSGDNRVLGESSVNEFDSTIETLQSLENDINSIKSQGSWITSWVNKINNEILSNKNNVKALSDLEKHLPELFGLREEKKYLLITYQVTGNLSFPHYKSYSILQLHNRKITASDLQPLESLKDQLELNNFDTDDVSRFLEPEKSAEELNISNMAGKGYQIYKDAKGETVDGVLLIDEAFLLSLSQKLNTGNDPTKNFKELIESLPERMTFDLTNMLLQSLASKKMVLNHKSEQIRSVLSSNNWDGNLLNLGDDYFYVSIEPSFNEISNISEDPDLLSVRLQYKGNKPDNAQYTRELAIVLENKGQQDVVRNVKVLLPKEVFLNKAYLFEDNEQKNILRNVLVKSYSGKAMFSTELIIKSNSFSTVSFNYESSEIDSVNSKNLHIIAQKNPFMGNVPLTVNLDYPLGVPGVFKPSASINTNNNSIQYEGVFDKNISLNFPL